MYENTQFFPNLTIFGSGKRGKRDGSDIVKLRGPADVRAIFTRARQAGKAGRVRYC